LLLSPVPFCSVSPSKNEGLPGGIILRNTPIGFEVIYFVMFINDKGQCRADS
jgi:hypothetical protein